MHICQLSRIKRETHLPLNLSCITSKNSRIFQIFSKYILTLTKEIVKPNFWLQNMKYLYCLLFLCLIITFKTNMKNDLKSLLKPKSLISGRGLRPGTGHGYPLDLPNYPGPLLLTLWEFGTSRGWQLCECSVVWRRFKRLHDVHSPCCMYEVHSLQLNDSNSCIESTLSYRCKRTM